MGGIGRRLGLGAWVRGVEAGGLSYRCVGSTELRNGRMVIDWLVLRRVVSRASPQWDGEGEVRVEVITDAEFKIVSSLIHELERVGVRGRWA